MNRGRVLWIVVAVLGLAMVAAADDDALKGRHVTVSGEGMVRGRPDLAIATLGVTAYDTNAAQAMAASREQMAAVLASLRDSGVEDADVLTTDFSIHRERVQPQRRRGDEPDDAEQRFVVRNLVRVTIRDLTRAGAILDAVIEAGANEVRGIQFTIEDDADFADRARALASQDARHKAEQLAQLHDARLGRVLRISESGIRPMRADMMMARSAEAASSTVSAGEMTLGAHVQVVYELKD